MVQHLSFSEWDMAGLKNGLDRYEAAGLHPELSVWKTEGIANIRMLNPMKTTRWAHLEFHKLARPGWFGIGSRAWWVVQLYSEDHPGEKIRRGCVARSNQATAFSVAEVDLKHNFLSSSTFEVAASGY